MKSAFLSVSIATLALFGVTACGGGSSSSSGGSTNGGLIAGAGTPTPTPVTPASVTISGQATFDLVPFNNFTNGLDYDSISQAPIRGATIQAVDASGDILASGQTDDNGDYSLSVPNNTNLQIRVLSEIVQTGTPGFNVAVVDNTSENALYAAQGALLTSGTSNSIRNLNADSGWNGTQYISDTARAAGPFAILDPIYDTVTAFTAVDSDLVLPPIEMGWSPSNIAVSGNSNIGQIGTSSYVSNGNGTGMIFILGDENADTDEYDRHVITHEWGHYFEDLVSRADTIGGPHGLGDRLDARLALSEGFGNALSGIILDDSVYRDSGGQGQAFGFGFDVESNNNLNPGWFSEGSTQSIIYDIFDGDADGVDNVALGLGPIYDALTAPTYINQPTFTTIYSLVDQIRAEAPGSVAGINAIVAGQSIVVTDSEGTGETNNGGVPTALPVFHTLTVGGPAVEVCSSNEEGTFNALGNRVYVTTNLAVSGAYDLRAIRTSGSLNNNPDIALQQGADFLGVASSNDTGQEILLNLPLQAGPLALEVFDVLNVSGFGANNRVICYDVSIEL